MPTNLFPRAYEKLILEDKEWLISNTADTLERQHIIAVLDSSTKEYRDRGYMEAMSARNRGADEEIDPTPWCSGCGAIEAEQCECGPICENN
jgi:hypothetical protein